MHMLTDSNCRVRAHTISMLTRLFENIDALSREDCRVFIDYILPERMVRHFKCLELFILLFS
jgi:hypothetical protein